MLLRVSTDKDVRIFKSWRFLCKCFTQQSCNQPNANKDKRLYKSGRFSRHIATGFWVAPLFYHGSGLDERIYYRLFAPTSLNYPLGPQRWPCGRPGLWNSVCLPSGSANATLDNKQCIQECAMLPGKSCSLNNLRLQRSFTFSLLNPTKHEHLL